MAITVIEKQTESVANTSHSSSSGLVEFLGDLAEGAVAALNGIAGDYIADRQSNLEVPMAFFHKKRPLPLEKATIKRAHPQATTKIVVLVHGLCCTERVWNFSQKTGEDYGCLLRRDLAFTPFYLRYNTGLKISENGRKFSRMLSRLVEAYPADISEIVLIGHSKGGLVIQRAIKHARENKAPWANLLERTILLGTPQLGAPLEKATHGLTRTLSASRWSFARDVGQFLNFRSAAIKDLRRGTPQKDRGAEDGARHYVAAGTINKDPNRLLTRVAGDFLVRVPSALGPKPFGQNVDGWRIFAGTNHFRLARSHKVYWQIKNWCEDR